MNQASSSAGFERSFEVLPDAKTQNQEFRKEVDSHSPCGAHRKFDARLGGFEKDWPPRSVVGVSPCKDVPTRTESFFAVPAKPGGQKN